MTSDGSPPNFHVSYEKLKKIAEELRGGGDKDDDYWAWRNGSSDSDSEEDDFNSWLSSKRNNRNSPVRRKSRSDRNNRNNKDDRKGDRNRPTSRDYRDRSPDDIQSDDSRQSDSRPHPNKRKQEKSNKTYKAKDTEKYLWDPGDWKDNSSRVRHCINRNKTSHTAKGGGVIKLPDKALSKAAQSPKHPHSPIGVVKNTSNSQQTGPHDFIYSSEDSDSDGNITDDYPTNLTLSTPLTNMVSSVLNVIGIEKRIEKCGIEANQCSNTFCKESCNKFLGEGIRKKNSLEVLFGSFEEHHTEIIRLRQELCCTVCCAMMYDMDICQDKQAEAMLWKYVFYNLIQHYKTNIGSVTSDNVKTTLNTQLEEHISEGIQFYNMLVLQLQKRYKVNYKSYQYNTTGQNRTQVLALLLIHKLLLWIGDLYRYLSQTRDTDEWGQSRNYYLLAQTLAPRNPRPYHQLALLGKYAHRRLHAVYYFTLSLMVRNPFAQSKEMLLSVLAELRKKAQLLSQRDLERSTRNNTLPGSTKEVYSNKVIEWEFERAGDQALNIPESDIRKRYVVYLLSGLGSVLSNIDVDRVNTDFDNFNKFYQHHLKLTGFVHHEVYQQLLIVLLYTLYNTQHQHIVTQQLECFLFPCINCDLIQDHGNQEGDWLCKIHSPLVIILLFAQSQIQSDTRILEHFSVHFWTNLVQWLNALQTAITKYKKYRDFTEECVVLKEITILRGVELLASLQTITKPFYLKNLTREQSEDLARSVLIINTFEKLSVHVPFLECSDNLVFKLNMQSDVAIHTDKDQQSVPTFVEEQNDSISDSSSDSTSDSCSDIEIIAVRKLSINKDSYKEFELKNDEDVELAYDEGVAIKIDKNEGETTEITDLRSKKEELLKTIYQKEEKKKEVNAAVKEILGSRIHITVKPKFIVPDTNCFLSDIEKTQRLAASGRYKILIPLIVISEITGLCKSTEKGEKAALALDILQKHIKDNTVSLLTSKGSILSGKQQNYEEERSKGCNDDLILNGVVQLSDVTGHKKTEKDTIHLTRCVVLLTDDSNLRVKAHSHNVAVQSLSDFVSCAHV